MPPEAFASLVVADVDADMGWRLVGSADSNPESVLPGAGNSGAVRTPSPGAGLDLPPSCR